MNLTERMLVALLVGGATTLVAAAGSTATTGEALTPSEVAHQSDAHLPT